MIASTVIVHSYRSILSIHEHDCVPPDAVSTATHDIDGPVGDDERDVTRLHHPPWIGDIGRIAVPRCQCQPSYLGTAACGPTVVRHECRPAVEELTQGHPIAKQEGVLEQRFELFRGSRVVAHVQLLTWSSRRPPVRRRSL